MIAFTSPIDSLPSTVEGPVTTRQAVVVVGSARPRGQSSSEALGRALLDALARQGVPGVIAHAQAVSLETRRGLDVLEGCDLLVLATPLYFDALPSHVVAWLQRVVAHRREMRTPRAMALAALVNCGTPDARQADPALAMCALAARDAAMAWRGGLAFGQGETIHGRHPTRLGTAPYTQPLDAAACALAAGAPIPMAVRELAAQPPMSARRYAVLGNAGWILRRAGLE